MKHDGPDLYIGRDGVSRSSTERLEFNQNAKEKASNCRDDIRGRL